MKLHILFSIVAIAAFNTIDNREVSHWGNILNQLHVNANVVQLANYFPLRNSTYDPFYFHLDTLQSDR